MHVVTHSTALVEHEGLREHHGLTIINGELSADKGNDTFILRGLHIARVHLMAELIERGKLFIDSLLAGKLLSLKGQHRLVRVKLHQVLYSNKRSVSNY